MYFLLSFKAAIHRIIDLIVFICIWEPAFCRFAFPASQNPPDTAISEMPLSAPEYLR